MLPLKTLTRHRGCPAPPHLPPRSLALVWGYVLMQPDHELDLSDLAAATQERGAEAVGGGGGGAGGGGGGAGGGAQMHLRGKRMPAVYLTKEQAVVMHLLRSPAF
jgi:hypothetical protein